MSPTEKKEEIRKVCIKANPDIVEVRRKLMKHYTNDHLDSEESYWGKITVCHPIRLADVLLAIEANQKHFKPRKTRTGINSNGKRHSIISPYHNFGARYDGKEGHIELCIIYMDYDEEVNFTCEWNLRADDLERNPQTWDFLYELLINS